MKTGLFRLLVILLVLSAGMPAKAQDKAQARAERLSEDTVRVFRFDQPLSSADTCAVRNDDGMAWRIDGWVTGNELYKNYLDPSQSCADPYPYTVTEINMPMYFAAPTVIYVAVDIEVANVSDPDCPLPDTLLSISSQWELTIPGEGLYHIWVPLDTPVQVSGPFFAGFFLGSTIDSAAGAAVITDDNPSALCHSYNIWDTALGFVDLLNNDIYEFPGRLVLYASGYSGGGGDGGGDTTATNLAPLVFLSPEDGRTVYGDVAVWVHDTSGSGRIDHVVFEYQSNGSWYELSRDYTGESPLRNGISSSDASTGFYYTWNTEFLAEGWYTIRGTVVDTLGVSVSSEVSVYVEPTPPTPKIISPISGGDFCQPVTLLFSNRDEDLYRVDVFVKECDSLFSSGMTALNEFMFGDTDGNPTDGNRVTAGEYGEYYSAPVAAALLLKTWADRGVVSVMSDGGMTIPLDTLVERLAERFKVRENLGTFDEDVYRGLLEYNRERQSPLDLRFTRRPSYFDIRVALEEQERSVMLALGGQPTFWTAVDGFQGWLQPDGYYYMRICNPYFGVKESLPVRIYQGEWQLYFAGSWHPVEAMISAGRDDWTVSRTLIGSDGLSSDGWAFRWEDDQLREGVQYFITAVGRDLSDHADASSALLNHDCSAVFEAGDFNNDGVADLADLNVLINFYLRGGTPPIGGVERADTNCDGYVNISDIVYFANFLFGLTGPPCN